MSHTTLSLTQELILLDLASAGAKGPMTRAVLLTKELRKEIRAAELNGALLALRDRGMVIEAPRKPGGRSVKWSIESPGREAIHASLGHWPQQVTSSWKQRARRILMARHALGIDARAAAAVAESDGLAAYFLASRLGEDFRPGTTIDSLAQLCAAAALGTPNGKLPTLWKGLVRRALAPDPRAGDQHPQAASHPPASDALFVQQVTRAARSAPPSAWLGEHKLFIDAAWDAWQRATGLALSLDAFKQRLIDALKAREIALSRADFTPDIPPERLRQAEVRYGDETFHCITIHREGQE